MTEPAIASNNEIAESPLGVVPVLDESLRPAAQVTGATAPATSSPEGEVVRPTRGASAKKRASAKKKASVKKASVKKASVKHPSTKKSAKAPPARKDRAKTTQRVEKVALHKKATPQKASPKKSSARNASAKKTEPKKAQSAKPVSAWKEVPEVRAKLVRDSFTMPQADFALIHSLKERALDLRRPTKKGELLRAGLHSLQKLSDAQFRIVLDLLPKLKAGRPRKKAKDD